MSTNAPITLTPAQVNLLDFCSHLEAHDIYKCLNTVLSLSISNYEQKEDADDPDFRPAPKALEAWSSALYMLQHIHDIAVEGKNKK